MSGIGFFKKFFSHKEIGIDQEGIEEIFTLLWQRNSICNIDIFHLLSTLGDEIKTTIEDAPEELSDEEVIEKSSRIVLKIALLSKYLYTIQEQLDKSIDEHVTFVKCLE